MHRASREKISLARNKYWLVSFGNFIFSFFFFEKKFYRKIPNYLKKISRRSLLLFLYEFLYIYIIICVRYIFIVNSFAWFNIKRNVILVILLCVFSDNSNCIHAHSINDRCSILFLWCSTLLLTVTTWLVYLLEKI